MYIEKNSPKDNIYIKAQTLLYSTNILSFRNILIEKVKTAKNPQTKQNVALFPILSNNFPKKSPKIIFF